MQHIIQQIIAPALGNTVEARPGREEMSSCLSPWISSGGGSEETEGGDLELGTLGSKQ